jgi:hypothetical protein
LLGKDFDERFSLSPLSESTHAGKAGAMGDLRAARPTPALARTGDALRVSLPFFLESRAAAEGAAPPAPLGRGDLSWALAASAAVLYGAFGAAALDAQLDAWDEDAARGRISASVGAAPARERTRRRRRGGHDGGGALRGVAATTAQLVALLASVTR